MQEALHLLLFVLIAIAIFVVAISLSRIINKHFLVIRPEENSFVVAIKILFSAATGPILFVAGALSLNLMAQFLAPFVHSEEIKEFFNHFLLNIIPLGGLIAILWFLLRFFSGVKQHLIQWGLFNNNQQMKIVAPVVLNGLKIILVIFLLNLLLPSLKLSSYYFQIAEKILSILLITAITWIILQTINAIELLAINRYEAKVTESFKARGIYTQIHIMKKIAVIFVSVISIALVLMIFDGVRELGTSILASAGLATAIIGFAGQKSLAGILGGFQIALTQPIRIQDQVIVEGEFGEIEEITLTYIVIKLWDLRRLIVPVNYFLEKPFQNWTRTSKDLLVTIFFYFDYTLPIEPLRKELMIILNQSIDWNTKLAQLQVTDAKESTMEIRVLTSANDTSAAWNLKCEIREKLITFVREKYPQSLPRTRADIAPLLKKEIAAYDAH